MIDDYSNINLKLTTKYERFMQKVSLSLNYREKIKPIIEDSWYWTKIAAIVAVKQIFKILLFCAGVKLLQIMGVLSK